MHLHKGTVMLSTSSFINELTRFQALSLRCLVKECSLKVESQFSFHNGGARILHCTRQPKNASKDSTTACAVPYIFLWLGKAKGPGLAHLWESPVPTVPNAALSRGPGHSRSPDCRPRARGTPFCLPERHPACELKSRHP